MVTRTMTGTSPTAGSALRAVRRLQPLDDEDRQVTIGRRRDGRRRCRRLCRRRREQANPEATIQVGADTIPVRATVATPEEKAVLWPKVVAAYQGYEGYQGKTTRDIPVVILTPQAGA